MKKILIAATVACLAAPAMAADLPTTKGPPPAPMVYVPPAFTWTGFYLGLNGGFNYTNFGPNFGSSWGGVIGGTAGYNQQLGQFVVGLETDYGFSGAGVHGSSAFGATEAHINDIFTVRARAGYAMDRTLFFLTGGYSGASFRESVNSLPSTQTTWKSGLALGGGIEYAITNNVTAKVEDIYTWYGNTTYFANTIEQNSNHQTGNLLRVGVNYKF